MNDSEPNSRFSSSHSIFSSFQGLGWKGYSIIILIIGPIG